MTPSIPVVDLSSSDVGSEFQTACGDVGFAYLTEHGIAAELIEGVFAASAAFHALPLEQKMAIDRDRRHCGYIPIASSTDRTSTLAEVTKPNQSASFMMMREDSRTTITGCSSGSAGPPTNPLRRRRVLVRLPRWWAHRAWRAALRARVLRR